MKFISSLVIVLFLTTTLLNAQSNSVLQYIPKKDVLFIGTVTPHETFMKLDEATRNDYNIAPILANALIGMTQETPDDKLSESLTARFENPKETGIETQKNVFFWVAKAKSAKTDQYAKDPMYFQLVITVLDITKLEILLADLFGEQATAPMMTGKSKNIMHKGTLINWTDKRMILTKSSLEQSFFEEDEEFEARETEALRLQANALGNEYSPEETLLNDANFQQHLQKKADIALWMDYDNLLSEVPVNQIPREARATANAVMGFFSGYKIAAYVKIQDKELVLEYTNYYGPEINKIMRAANNIKANKNLLKYVQGQNLMAFYSGTFNIQGYADTFVEELKKVLNTTKEGKILSNMIDILDIVIDEDEMYTLWNGDVMMAMTDITTVEREVTDYEYNDESGKWDKKVVTKVKDPLPIFVMGGSYGSKENVLKFIELGINIGGLSKRADGVYAIAGSLREVGTEVFVIINKGTLLITNNIELTEKRKGFKCKERMNKTDWKNTLAHNTYGFIDIQKIIKVMEKVSKEADKEMPKDMAEIKEKIDRIELKTLPEGSSGYTTQLRLIMKGDNQNTLNTLVDFGFKGFMMVMMNGGFGGSEGDDTKEMDDFDDEFKRL